MSEQHEQFEEESRGEPSYQTGYADVPGQKLQAASPGAATSTTTIWTVYALSWRCFR